MRMNSVLPVVRRARILSCDEVLTLLRTATQQGKQALDFLSATLRAPIGRAPRLILSATTYLYLVSDHQGAKQLRTAFCISIRRLALTWLRRQSKRFD